MKKKNDTAFYQTHDLIMENGDIINIEIKSEDYEAEVEPIWDEIKESIQKGLLWWCGNWSNVKTSINNISDRLEYINCKKVIAIR